MLRTCWLDITVPVAAPSSSFSSSFASASLSAPTLAPASSVPRPAPHLNSPPRLYPLHRLSGSTPDNFRRHSPARQPAAPARPLAVLGSPGATPIRHAKSDDGHLMGPPSPFGQPVDRPPRAAAHLRASGPTTVAPTSAGSRPPVARLVSSTPSSGHPLGIRSHSADPLGSGFVSATGVSETVLS